MEPTRSRRKPRKRKPFTDLRNSIPSSSLPSSQSSSSSLLKPQTKSSLSLPLKSLLNNNLNSNLNSNPKFTATESTTNENVNNDKKKKDKEKVQSKKANPSSMLSPLPETAFVSVSNRRDTAEKRKSKEKEIAEPLSCSLETRMPGLSDNVNNDKKKEKEKSQSNKANPSSTLSPLPKVPSVSGIGDCVDFEPSTVFNRRHTAEKGKGKGKEIAEPLSCSFEARRPDLRKKKDGDGDIDLAKSCPVPRKKKQLREKAEVNASKHELPHDFIDKQIAYFAEVDAFELEEEEASVHELE